VLLSREGRGWSFTARSTDTSCVGMTGERSSDGRQAVDKRSGWKIEQVNKKQFRIKNG
jgi:hypothetical protein